MADNSDSVKHSINFKPRATPDLSDTGDLGVDSADNRLKFNDGSSISEVLLQKDAEATGFTEAANVDYDNSTSGLTATDLQEAIDEVDGRVDTVETDLSTAQGDISTLQGDVSTLQSGKQDVDADLTALAGLTTSGILARTGAGTASTRTITGTSNEINVSNGDGVSGNPTVGISNNPTIPGSHAMRVPRGTTAERPASPLQGQIRYNTDTNQFEIRNDGAWHVVATDLLNNLFSGNNTFSGQLNMTGSRNITITTDATAALGAVNNYNNTTPGLEFTGTGLTSISGFSSTQAGRLLVLVNRTGSNVSILDEGSGSTASHRIRTGTGAPITLANNASLNLVYLGSHNRWHVIGGTGSGSGSGGTNFITNGSAEADTTGWATYADAAASSPVDGTGGSPNVTWTRTTTTPLVGTASFLFTKDAANRQGEGASFDFTIDNAYQAKVLQIQFEYAVASGTFAAGSTSADSDITVWIYDVTNNVLIQPTTYRLFASSSLSTTFVSNFQTASNSTSYRLIFHCATTSAVAYGLEIDDIRVSPSQYVYGTPITDWTSYTPTVTAQSGSVTNATHTGRWRRVGDSIEIDVTSTFSSTSAVFTRPLYSLPIGLSIDTAKLASSEANKILGYGTAQDTASNAYPLQVAYNSNTTFFPWPGRSDTTYLSFAEVTNAIPFTFNSTDSINLKLIAPIAGWSSSVQTSDQADSRVVAASYSFNSIGIIGGANIAGIWNTAYDTHAAFSNGNGRFTAPVSGFYRVSVLTLRSTGTGATFQAFINNTTGVSLVAYSIAGGICSGSTTLQLRAGDFVTFRIDSSITALASVAIERLSQASLISATELVTVQAASSAGTALSNGNTIIFGTKNFDSHNAYDSATGIFTAPVSGTYEVSAFIQSSLFTPSAGNQYALNVCRDGTTTTYQVAFVTTNAAVSQVIVLTGNTQIRLNAGQTVRMTISVSSGTYTLLNNATTNVLNIKRIGI